MFKLLALVVAVMAATIGLSSPASAYLGQPWNGRDIRIDMTQLGNPGPSDPVFGFIHNAIWFDDGYTGSHYVYTPGVDCDDSSKESCIRIRYDGTNPCSPPGGYVLGCFRGIRYGTTIKGTVYLDWYLLHSGYDRGLKERIAAHEIIHACGVPDSYTSSGTRTYTLMGYATNWYLSSTEINKLALC